MRWQRPRRRRRRQRWRRSRTVERSCCRSAAAALLLLLTCMQHFLVCLRLRLSCSACASCTSVSVRPASRSDVCAIFSMLMLLLLLLFLSTPLSLCWVQCLVVDLPEPHFPKDVFAAAWISRLFAHSLLIDFTPTTAADLLATSSQLATAPPPPRPPTHPHTASGWCERVDCQFVWQVKTNARPAAGPK